MLSSSHSRIALTAGGLLLAIIAAAFLDKPVAAWIHLLAPLEGKTTLIKILKTPGQAYFTIALVLLLAIFYKPRRRGILLLAIAALISWSNELIKFAVGRTRPYKLPEYSTPEPFVLHPFHTAQNLCFPSGHASLEFATAFALAILLPRCRWLFLAMGVFFASERVIENAHWLSDVIAGAALGCLSAYLARAIVDRAKNKKSVTLQNVS